MNQNEEINEESKEEIKKEPLREVIITPEHPDLDQIKQLYESSFPVNERMPFPIIQSTLSDSRILSGWYLGEKLAALSFIILYEDLAYISYIATDPSLRNHGYGKALLEELKKKYSGFRLLGDIELPDPAKGNTDFASRRKAFYLRNGFEPCGFRFHFYGVDYEMISWNGTVTKQEWISFVGKNWNKAALQFLFFPEEKA